MLIVIIAFMICWLPLAVNTLIDTLKKSESSECHNSHTQAQLINYLCYCAVHYISAVNPIIYAFRIVDVRIAMKRLFRMKEDQNNRRLQTYEIRNEIESKHFECIGMNFTEADIRV